MENALKLEEFWIFENKNRFSKSKYTQEEAAELAKMLSNCKDCVDCENCENCYNCDDCVNCEDCVDCVSIFNKVLKININE